MGKVTVRIYGQDYTLIGDKNEEDIRIIADHVDEQMKDIGKNSTETSLGRIAVLSAVNIGEEFFDAQAECQRLRSEKEKLAADAAYYMNMLEKVKKSTQQSQEDSSQLENRIREEEEKLQRLRERCNEYEASFFDLQMENIKLKNELEKLKEDA